MTASIRAGSVKADRFDIRYLEAGTGPAVICLHGADGLRLSQAHRVLAERNRLIALEIPTSDSLRTLDDIAPILNKAVEALGIENFSLVGHSAGADLALRMAIARPEPVTSLILVAPLAIRPPAVEPMARAKADADRAAVQPAWSQEETTPDHDARRRKFFHGLIGDGRDTALEERMAQIEVPVLVLFGTSDAIVSTDAARHYSALLRKCFTVMVYDATHDVEADRPEAVAAIVGNFLAHGEGFVINRDNGIINP